MFCTENEHFKIYLAPRCNLHALSSLKTTQGRVLRKQQDHVAPSMIDEWVEIHRIGIDYYLTWICLQVWMSGIAMQLTLKWVWIWLSNKYWLFRPNKSENTKGIFVWENSSFFETEVLNIEKVFFFCNSRENLPTTKRAADCDVSESWEYFRWKEAWLGKKQWRFRHFQRKILIKNYSINWRRKGKDSDKFNQKIIYHTRTQLTLEYIFLNESIGRSVRV